MRVIMFVFFYFEGAVLFLQFYGDVYVHIYIILLILIIFHVPVAELAQAVYKFTLAVNQYQFLQLSIFIYSREAANIVFASNLKVICTKIRGGVYDTSTIFGGYKIA